MVEAVSTGATDRGEMTTAVENIIRTNVASAWMSEVE